MEQNEIVVKLLSAIKKNPEQSQRSLSKAIGVSVGKVNYVVKELAKKGIIKTERFLNSNNKWQHRYILTPEGIKEKARITREFVKRKMAEYESLLNED